MGCDHVKFRACLDQICLDTGVLFAVRISRQAQNSNARIVPKYLIKQVLRVTIGKRPVNNYYVDIKLQNMQGLLYLVVEGELKSHPETYLNDCRIIEKLWLDIIPPE